MSARYNAGVLFFNAKHMILKNVTSQGYNGARPGMVIKTDDKEYIATLKEFGFVDVEDLEQTEPTGTPTELKKVVPTKKK